MTETHEHRWAGWWPSMLSTAAAVAREQRQCMDCGLTEDRPTATGWPTAWTERAVPDTALGRCQALLQCHRETGHEGGHEAAEDTG